MSEALDGSAEDQAAAGRTLRVEALRAGYRPGMPIVTDLALVVGPREVVCIIGPNGAGKSTVLKAIAGLIGVEGGRIRYGASELVGVAPHRLAGHGVAYVPQTGNVFETLSVRQNLALAAQRSHAARRAGPEAMLALFPLLEAKQRERARSLSGGQRQLLALAMALVVEPTLVLMDEPTAGLSPKAAAEVLALVRDIAARGASVLLVEQNARAALRISDRAYILADGRNQLDGQAQALLDDPAVADIYLGGRARGPA